MPAAPTATPAGWGDSAEMTRFVDALIAKMTLEEKISQMRYDRVE